MPELNKRIYTKRVVFPPGEQNRFLRQVSERVTVSPDELATRFKVCPRTLRDWKREKYSLPLRVVRKIEKEFGIFMPKGAEIKEPFWYAGKGARVGGRAVVEKYGHVGGDPSYRKKKWREWWEREGRYKQHSHIGVAYPIREPNFSEELAEFTGIVMGDGSLSRLQVEISCHRKLDREYALFIKRLIRSLFGVEASFYYPRNSLVLKIVVSRRRLVDFCKTKMGLSVGNKLQQGLDIPPWVKRHINFQKACIRGLIDTDGSIFEEKHKVRGKIYSYKRLNFTSASPQLRDSVFGALDFFGLSPSFRGGKRVQIEKQKKILEYFEVIGTNNPKHKRKILEEYR